jgi:thiol-disulfide isomerase/thioredoxin
MAACGSTSTDADPIRIELENMDGSATSIAEVLAGRPLLVSLWAVWCQPCRRELPELQKIADSDQGVDVLAVNVGDDPERITTYMDDMALLLPVAIDPVGDLLTTLDVSTVPATVLFGESGEVLWSHLGAVSADQVDEALRRHLPGR